MRERRPTLLNESRHTQAACNLMQDSKSHAKWNSLSRFVTSQLFLSVLGLRHRGTDRHIGGRWAFVHLQTFASASKCIVSPLSLAFKGLH